ncbi:DUF4082 domain-containing protein [Geobacter sp. SVR]|uniref:DUF4082 domain-containing protein n=1 Tax=Geobacter sp. SVR TaxID=2495594 RepID=UPI00143F01BF|nr:DUF4082 domain-containing protein [Geobacter sp. SVR]BCS54971.1 hypothetical protein GSVR_32790 [Geobacter sp. SVR]GCF86170.1 hypothetical protein GSbR_27700 [Geobacter sp. SVR]
MHLLRSSTLHGLFQASILILSLFCSGIAFGATIWPVTAVPKVVADYDGQPLEVGVKFRSDVNGTITGLRFYKGAANTGTHVASLWTSAGTRLATATFSSESASGWQEVTFATPVAITANTTYVASYYSSTGYFAVDFSYFLSGGMDNAPLHALANGVDGGNGVYRYGSSGFPNQTYSGNNYWVDVVFNPAASGDTTPSVVTAFTVPSSASSLTVAITSFTATDNTAVTGYLVTETSTAPSPTASGWTAAAPSSYTFASAGSKTLYAWAKDAAGNVSAAKSAAVTITLADTTPPVVTAFTIPSSASSLTVAITSFTATDNIAVSGFLVTETSTVPSPTATGWSAAAPASYTCASAGSKTLYAWAKDAAGNVSAAKSAAVTITIASARSTIWPATAVPKVVADYDGQPLEVGVKFRSDVNGTITGLRFYKGTANTGTHVANLWTSAGTRLTTATFSGESASGWQEVTFTTPAAITANTTYVASYYSPTGYFAVDLSYFLSGGVDNAPLHALANGVDGGNGVYKYGTSGFPNQTYSGNNYWVDVVFSPAASGDTTPPVVTAFTVPSGTSSLTVPITAFVATDNVGVTGFLVTESSGTPSASASGWSSTPPASYTVASAGSKTLYAWAKDAAGNVSAAKSAAVTVTLSDATAPTVTAFSVPSSSSTLIVSITSFTATDNIAVTGYLVTETSTAPSPTSTGWSATAPSSYTCASAGSKTLYAWARDAAGNVSAAKSAAVTITLSSSGPEPAGWYAGDMHVHRSCGGTPDPLSSFPLKMAANNLSVISLLADSGNGEVQDQAQDLPRVNGQDDPVSTAGRIVHWDAEWHWDPTYFQYPFQALGGHVVALGLQEAHQMQEEYTLPIFEWARQQNGIAGFAHMQYLDNNIPQNLNCCTPLEYPVEVALGSSDFISLDVAQSGVSYDNMCPDCAIQAYYRLLNCGFRPGLAAGTDYPCNSGSPLGSLLTYVQVGDSPMTYRSWIEGIAKGRTVVSRNGHNEFLDLKVNSTAAPGDEIKLTGGGSVQVTIQWSAGQNLSGTIELVQNGVVVASKQASVSSGTGASLTATINFTGSGWLAARRMGSDGHQVHTGAIFVTVDNLPVRASASDADFYVQWMDNLLAKTSPGGAWNSYFSSDLSKAQARYQAARTLYQQIAVEAGPLPSSGSIFTSQTPTLYENDAAYELGTRFRSDVNGQITQVRVYTNQAEGGSHTVRIWRVSDAAVVAGPYSWSIASGTLGWKAFTLPTPLNITANSDYIVAVSNSSDRYYAEAPNALNAAVTTGHLQVPVGGGVYSTVSGAMPTSVWQNTNYFRDVVFVAQ